MFIDSCSIASSDTKASASVYSRHFNLSRAVGKYCTNFDDEVDAIHTTLLSGRYWCCGAKLPMAHHKEALVRIRIVDQVLYPS